MPALAAFCAQQPLCPALDCQIKTASFYLKTGRMLCVGRYSLASSVYGH